MGAARETSEFKTYHIPKSRCPYMAGILPIRRKTPNNQSINRYCRCKTQPISIINDFVSLLTEEYHEVLCHDPSFLQDSISIICVGDPLAQPVVIASSYSGNIESCPQRHSWEPLTLGPCYSNALNSLCYNDDVCTVDSQDVFMDNSTICLLGDVFVLKLQYRCQSTSITYFFKN